MDTLEDLDISNDPDVERLGANATVQCANEYWNMLYDAAKKDAFAYDPLWNDHNLDDTGDHHNGDNINANANQYSFTKHIVLTQSKEHDYRLYRRFRSNLSKTFWNVEHIVMPNVNLTIIRSNTNATNTKQIQNNPLCNEKWQSLLLACEGVIPDFNFITLLRPNVYDFPYHDFLFAPDELGIKESQDTNSFLSQYIIVPRMQFIYIEIARCYEGYYSTKKFRQMLQLYTIKGIDERLQCVFCTKLLPALSCGRSDNSNDAIHIQRNLLQLLNRLATEWPYPSKYTLRTTGIVSTLQDMLKQSNRFVIDSNNPQQLSILHPIQEACRRQLQNWHDLIQLRRLEKSLVCSNNAKSQYCDSIQRLVQKSFPSLVRSTNGGSPLISVAGRNGWNRFSSSNDSKKFEQSMCQSGRFFNDDSYVTKTTSTLSDVIVSSLCHVVTDGSITNSSRLSMAALFRDFGIVIVPNYCTEQQIEQCSEHAHLSFEQLQQEQLAPRNIQIMGQNTFDFLEVRQRPGHRVDNRYKILDNPQSPIATLGKILLREIIDHSLFSNDNSSNRTVKQTDNVAKSSPWKLLYAGVVHAFPRDNETKEHPPSQFWHRDGPSLFENQDDSHHATHCFNVFVPLVDVNQENGTTEFVPGTHEDKRHNQVMADLLLNRADKYALDAGIIRADLKAGSLIFFDVRLIHRGLSNQSSLERPMLYFTFGRDWFQEKHMFQKTESLRASGNNVNENSLESSIMKLCIELYSTISGQRNTRKDDHRNGDRGESFEYGHPHYTLRFDLLLFEQWMMSETGNDIGSTAMSNYAAVLRFHNLSNKQKDKICRDFIQVLSSSDAWAMKNHVLKQACRSREEQRNATTETMLDFASIQHDLCDVAVLYKLTVQLLLTRSTQDTSNEPLLSQLGFTEDENGLYIALALLKVYSISELDCSCAANAVPTVPYATLEECFTLWWNAVPSPSRFQSIASACTSTTAANKIRAVIVVFSSLGSGLCRAEWVGTLKAIGVYNQKPQVDVLHVVDFAYSWYSQDPTCTWKGYEYYMKELSERLQPYSKIFFLGDSMGGSAALRFSSLAHSVLVFTPQIDIQNYRAVTRDDFTSERRAQVHHDILRTMRDETNNKAIVAIHYGRHCREDVQQLQPLMLERKSHVQLIDHDYDDHVLSLHLRDLGKLTGLLSDAIVQQFLLL